MATVICAPELTMEHPELAEEFYRECKNILEEYVMDVRYISSRNQLNQAIDMPVSSSDLLIFFTSENGIYDEVIIELIKNCKNTKSRIWPVAILDTPACRMPPDVIQNVQSFDVSSYNENRCLLNENMKAVAQVFTRKIIAQILPPLYQDEVLYFISHKRMDGEHIAACLADKLRQLIRERNVYRDVVNVKVGDDAQEDIDEHLKKSDVLIFLQTEKSKESQYIEKELCCAFVYNIPVLWIQIDDASASDLPIKPGEKPMLSYHSSQFESEKELEQIANEVEENCFRLIMNSSKQVYTYIGYIRQLCEQKRNDIAWQVRSLLAYKVVYKEKTKDRYDDGTRRHFIQCFGRNPKDKELKVFANEIAKRDIYKECDRLFLLSVHGSGKCIVGEDKKIIEENYDDYIDNLESVLGVQRSRNNKRVIISGAFPDCDEIYKNSLMDALVTYSREIIKRGYILVFGAHPTFQKIIFKVGNMCSSDSKYAIEMHMSSEYTKYYNLDELRENCTLVVSDGLQAMRESMICEKPAEMIICLGGKKKPNKAEQGVDIEVQMARRAGIPVALVGTVGGRSAELAAEIKNLKKWDDVNPWGADLNEKLYCNVNHREMAGRLLDLIKKDEEC